MGDPYLFQSIAAAVIGGISILGGRGNYLGTVAGAISLVALISLLQAENMPDYGRSIVYGVAILVVLVLFGREERVVRSPGRHDATVLSGLRRSTVRSSMTTENTFPNEDADVDRPGRVADLTLRDAMLVKISWIRSFLAVAERGGSAPRRASSTSPNRG